MTVSSITELVVPIVIVAILLCALCKQVPAFDVFCQGASKGFPLVVSILPYVAAILVSVGLLRASGVTALLTAWLAPVFHALGVPSELCELVILRQFSGSGSIALFRDLVSAYGVDSYVCRCAAVMLSSTDTVFYVAAVYLAGSKVKKLRYCIPVCLASSFVGVLLSCLLCRVM